MQVLIMPFWLLFFYLCCAFCGVGLMSYKLLASLYIGHSFTQRDSYMLTLVWGQAFYFCESVLNLT
jgi:hypothetical protein